MQYMKPPAVVRKPMKFVLTRETMQSELQSLSEDDLLSLSDAIEKEMHRRLAENRRRKFNKNACRL